MKQNEEKAIQSFQSGLNCAQSVVSAYSESLDFDFNQAISLSTGFGGGMGRLQETCGAVTGAFMILGLYNSRKFKDNKERKEKTYAMVQDLSKQFKNIHGTTDCRTLLGCDLRTEEGMIYHIETNQSKNICEKCIANVVGILDEMLKK